MIDTRKNSEKKSSRVFRASPRLNKQRTFLSQPMVALRNNQGNDLAIHEGSRRAQNLRFFHYNFAQLHRTDELSSY